jgi:hypothetical protein
LANTQETLGTLGGEADGGDGGKAVVSPISDHCDDGWSVISRYIPQAQPAIAFFFFTTVYFFLITVVAMFVTLG